MLIKWVVVLDKSGTWVSMHDTRIAAEGVCLGTPSSHVERWTYPRLGDGTHGKPGKVRFSDN